MKRILLSVIACLATVLPLCAQNSEQELTFIYISQDVNTPSSTLVERLRSVYDDCLNYPESCAAIFYLANGEYPKVVKVNVGKDNHKDFVDIVYALQSNIAHDVDPYTDIETIQKVFEEVDIVDDVDNPRFASVQWIYYVNSTFWNLKYNEDVIAPLYFIMEMEDLIKKKYLSVTMYYSEEHDKIPYNRTSPFGEKLVCPLLRQAPLPY